GGLVARFSGPLNDNYYFGQIAGNGGGGFVATIFKTVGGITTMLATGAVTPTSPGNLQGTLEFETAGPSLKLIFTPQGQTQGKLVAFADDLSLTTGTVGMRLGATTMLGNFVASAIVQTTPTLPFTDDFSSPVNVSDGSQLSRNWTDRNGNITVIAGM